MPGRWRRPRRLSRSHLGWTGFFSEGISITTVTRREQSAERHDEAAAPDPVDERLVLHAYQPGLGVERIAERDIQVARQPRVDRGLGHRHVLHGVDTLLRVHHRNRSTIS